LSTWEHDIVELSRIE